MRSGLKQMRRNERVLIATNILLQSRAAFMSVFLMAFMMNVSLNDSPRQFIIYSIIRYALMGIFSALLVNFFKRHTLLAWRSSMVFALLEILVIIFFGKNPHAVYFLAAFSALGGILYWRPKMFFDATEISDKERASYVSISQSCVELAKIVMPIILGFAIDGSSYQQAAVFVLALSAIQLVISFGFKPTKRKSTKRYKVMDSVRYLFKHNSTYILIFTQLLQGLLTSSSAYIVVSTIALNRMADNSVERGVAAALASMLAITILSIYRHFARNLRAQRVMLVSLAPMVILLPLFVFFFEGDKYIGIAFYVLTASVLASFLNATVGCVRIQDILSRHLTHDDDRMVLEIIGEYALSVGRVLSLVILLIIDTYGSFRHELIFVFLSSFLIFPLISLSIPSGKKLTRRPQSCKK